MDPYEQELYKLFNSHDIDNCGSLDRDGLMQLCHTLQLDEQGSEIAKLVLSEKRNRATFGDFKEALLSILGKMQNKNLESPIKESSAEINSPDREVSPKYIYGSKKYGRRSRPRTEELSPIYDGSPDKQGSPVQRSNSEVLNKKRRTNFKLKRCTSLPGHNDLDYKIPKERQCAEVCTEEIPDPEMMCTEEMLRNIWERLGVGEDGFLDPDELVDVCNAISMDKLADEVIKYVGNYEQKISLKQVCDVIKRDETWLSLFSVETGKNDNVLRCSSEELFPDSQTFQYVSLGPDGNGYILVETLIDMWESVGIHSPKQLISDLGFHCNKIDIAELANTLSQQTQTISESTRNDFQSTHTSLLLASLAFYQYEIKSFRNILEQLRAEREKLKYDVVEANNRATLLAQEVDDNHVRMEQNTVNQVKLLEHRHAEMLKEVTSQFAKDKEQLNCINQGLEGKISMLEVEVQKLKNDLVVAQKYALDLEKEKHVLSGRISELEKDKVGLLEKVEFLEAEKQSVSDMERQESEMLLAKLTALQIKNTQLKDKNDEMESEIESLTNQVMSMKSKASSTPTRSFNTLDQSMEAENISMICEGVGVKRRNDTSPTKDVQLMRMADGSPRLGKVRKYYKSRTSDNLEVPFTSSESGFDTEPESLSASTCDNEEVNRLQAKIAFLEHLLMQNNIPVPLHEESNETTFSTMQLTTRVQELEQIIQNVKNDVNKSDCPTCDKVKLICLKLENTLTICDSQEASDNSDSSEKSYAEQCIQTDLNIAYVEQKVCKLEEENQELSAKCTELQDCVEQLGNEYEKCEVYWQNKVDEERQFFEAEQTISGKNLQELIDKLKDYEEQYANQDMLDSRLPPIVETENLEKQFTDLEQELEDFKSYHEEELFKKEEEISMLKEQLIELTEKNQQMREAAVQADIDAEEQRILEKMKNFTSYVIENTSRFAEEMQHPQSKPLPALNWARDSPESASSLPPTNWNLQDQNSRQSASLPPSSCSSQSSTPCRPKRTRKHDKTIYKKHTDNKKTEQTSFQPSEQTVVLPISAFNNLMSRKNYLEQRVNHLQVCLKQQYFHNEQTLRYYCHQYQNERAELQAKLKFCQEKLDQQMRICNEQLSKLQKNDLFVKDLYVENAYLFANVERLEKQNRLLAQASVSKELNSV